MPADLFDLDDLEPARKGGDGGQLDLREYLQGLRQRWKLVVLVALVTLAAAALHYVVTPPQYQASTIIQIERRSLNPLSSSQMPWLENWWNMEYYPTQYQLLESRGLAERVVRNLRLMDDARLRAAATAAAATAGQDRAALGQMAQRLQSRLSVEPIRGTQLVRLTYRSDRPEETAQIVNGFAEAFIDWGIDDRSGIVVKASSFLGEQIEDLKQEISDREAELQAFSRTEDVLDFNPESNVTYQRLEALNQQYMTAKRDRIEKEAGYQELRALPRHTVADAESSGLVGDLMREQSRLEREYETRLQTLKEAHPQMVDMKAQIENGRRHLETVVEREAQRALADAQAAYQTALRQEQALAGEIETLKDQALDQSSAAVKFNNLQVEVETRRELLDELLRKQSETDVAARLQTNRESNVRVVDEALVPGAPFRPSLRANLMGGSAAGLALGVGLALLLQFLDRSIKRTDEVESLLGLPVLATVPDLSDEGRQTAYRAYGRSAATRVERRTDAATAIELVPHARPRMAVSETYRALRTALLLSTTEQLDVITVTSATAGEGKTVTAANLAVVLAQLGKRVLLIDADLRKPRLHSVFQVSNRTGLVSCLTAGMALDQAAHPTDVNDLWVCPSGPIPPNPSELLSSQRMQELLAGARESFDFVIVDTPPVLAVTDAILVGAMSCGVVLCLRAGRVLREEARACRDRLERADVKIFGAVLNGFRRHDVGLGKSYPHYYEAYVAEGDPRARESAAR